MPPVRGMGLDNETIRTLETGDHRMAVNPNVCEHRVWQLAQSNLPTTGVNVGHRPMGISPYCQHCHQNLFARRVGAGVEWCLKITIIEWP